MNYRQAVVQDIPGMMKLINSYADQGLMLHRSKLSMCETLQCFMVIEDDGEIVGVGGLHILWEDMAEIRSLAIASNYKGQGLGKVLVGHLEKRAVDLGIPRVISLTYQEDFFAKMGYVVVAKETLPHKVWKDCLNCAKYHNCDEIAMEKYVTPNQSFAQKTEEKVTTPVYL